jgi:hypothetical protein
MVVGAPFERVGIDLTGPHPKSKNGYTYILTYLNHFSKWAEAIPLRNKETTTVANALVDQIFTRVGVPLQMLSDQGKEFDSLLIHELCKRMDIRKIRTTAYKPSTNGATERLHRTLNGMLGRVVSESQRDWCLRLPFIIAAYRAARHEATGYSPNFIVYGRELAAPIDIVLGRANGEEYQSMDQFVEMKLLLMEEAHELVRQQLRLASARCKRRIDIDVKPREFLIGSWVWFYSPRRCVGRSPKWQRNYSGPFLVVKQLSQVLYVIQKSRRAKEILTHADKLKPFLGSAPDSWLNLTDSTDVLNDAAENSTPLEIPPTAESLVGENIDMVDISADLVATLNDQGSTNYMKISNIDLSDKSRLSPYAVEFRPKRQIRVPARYRDD